MDTGDPARQLTLRAILLSVVLTVVLAAANAYLGLFAGLTVATAIPAAVVSMGVLRLFGKVSVLENNIVATGASAGSSIAAGTIFTIPALVLLGAWQRFDYWWVLAIAGLGGRAGDALLGPGVIEHRPEAHRVVQFETRAPLETTHRRIRRVHALHDIASFGRDLAGQYRGDAIGVVQGIQHQFELRAVTVVADARIELRDAFGIEIRVRDVEAVSGAVAERAEVEHQAGGVQIADGAFDLEFAARALRLDAGGQYRAIALAESADFDLVADLQRKHQAVVINGIGISRHALA